MFCGDILGECYEKKMDSQRMIFRKKVLTSDRERMRKMLQGVCVRGMRRDGLLCFFLL